MIKLPHKKADQAQGNKTTPQPCLYCRKVRAIAIWAVLMYIFFQYVYLP